MEDQGGLFEILAKIKARPGMYLGNPSVSDLFIFLTGYKTARRELRIEPNTEELEFYQEFYNFIQKKYQIKTVNSWAKIIMLYCHNEKEGFEKFFALLDEFKQRNKTLDGDWVEILAREKNLKITKTLIKNNANS